jgi:hypothetical protein
VDDKSPRAHLRTKHIKEEVRHPLSLKYRPPSPLPHTR